MLLLIYSCNDRKERILKSKEEIDKKQRNIEFLCSLSENLQNGDTVLISFGIYGSFSKQFFKASLKKNLDSIFLEVRGQRVDGEKYIDLGKVEYGLKSYSDSLSFEYIFCKILNDSSISFNKKPEYKRIITILSAKSDRIDVYIENESVLNEYLTNYFIRLILFYYPMNQFIVPVSEAYYHKTST